MASYLYAGQKLLETSRGEPGSARDLKSGEQSEAALAFAREIWASHRKARLYEFSIDLWGAMESEVINTLYRMMDHGKDGDEILDIAATLEMPRPLPFPQMYIGLQAGVVLPDSMAEVRFVDGAKPHDLICVVLMGYLIQDSMLGYYKNAAEKRPPNLETDDDICVIEMLWVVTSDDNFVMPNVECVGGMWVNARSLAPWMVQGVLRLLCEEPPRKINPGLNQRMELKAFKKRTKHGILPKPYYIVGDAPNVRSTVKRVVAENANEALRRKISYRHDRDAHIRFLVKRGPLPLSSEQRVKLELRGYDVWTDDYPDAMTARRLTVRGHEPKSAAEWMATKATPVKATIVGSGDLPYIPGTRVRKS